MDVANKIPNLAGDSVIPSLTCAGMFWTAYDALSLLAINSNHRSTT